MRTRPLNDNTEVPVIGQGTWKLEQADRHLVEQTLNTGIDAGMTHIDTAEMYGDGTVEELLGAILARRRDELFLASKVLPQNATFDGTLRACERSLRRLRTDRLDLYLLHWPGDHPLEDTVAAFRRLREEGKIRRWGVSNFTTRDLHQLTALAQPCEIACNQVLYHLAERAIEHHIIPQCDTLRTAIVAYSPFGSGAFPPDSPGAASTLADIAHNRAMTPRQVALAFLARIPGLLLIPKASNPAHALDNAAAADLTLDPHEIAALDKTCPLGPDTGHLPTI